jgi:hypothetical protein
MTKPNTTLLPWDCLRVATNDLTAETLTKIARLYWTRRTNSVPAVLPHNLLLPVSRVLTMGAEKYTPRSWELDAKYHSVSQHFASMMRHATNPAELDEESGLPNTWHVACRYIMLATLIARGVVVDDRPSKQPNKFELPGDDWVDVVVDEGAGEGGGLS